jgi:hypothetical protein
MLSNRKLQVFPRDREPESTYLHENQLNKWADYLSKQHFEPLKERYIWNHSYRDIIKQVKRHSEGLVDISYSGYVEETWEGSIGLTKDRVELWRETGDNIQHWVWGYWTET